MRLLSFLRSARAEEGMLLVETEMMLNVTRGLELDGDLFDDGWVPQLASQRAGRARLVAADWRAGCTSAGTRHHNDPLVGA